MCSTVFMSTISVGIDVIRHLDMLSSKTDYPIYMITAQGLYSLKWGFIILILGTCKKSYTKGQ